jgi:hypothetical protein
MLLRRLPVLLAIVLSPLVSASPAAAVDIGQPGEPTTLAIHGFASQGFLVSSHNDYLAKSKNGSFELSEMGINFTASVTDKLRVGAQLFSRDLGRLGNYSAKFDWYYLDYRFADWFGLRAGRTKLPFGLYNDTNDIDSAHVPILLPQSIYPAQNRDFLLAQTGFEIYGRFDLHAAGALDYRLYAGTIFLDTSTTPNGPLQVLDLTTPFIVGGRAMWELPFDGLRIGGSVQSLRLDAKLTVKTAPVDVEIPATLWVGSVEYAAHDLLLAAEYSRWHVHTNSSNAALYPQTSVVSERAYAMASYRVRTWFTPGVYYSRLMPNVDHDEGRADVQHDIAATARFDVDPHWLFKLEGHYMRGTAGLNSALNGDVPLSQLARFWGVFLAKTTAYF